MWWLRELVGGDAASVSSQGLQPAMVLQHMGSEGAVLRGSMLFTLLG